MHTTLVCPDLHSPFQDQRAWNTFLAVARATKPDTLVIIGDFADFLSISAHSKTSVQNENLKAEVAVVKQDLKRIKRLNIPRVVYCGGNHEYRLDRYLANNARELDGLISVRSLLDIDELGFEWVPYKQSIQIGKMHYTHDIGRCGVNAARQSVLDFGNNITFGHCLPLDYDVATPDGWVKLSEVRLGDRVYAYRNGKMVETEVLEKVEYEYTGEMACFNNGSITQRMTDRHHIYTQDGRYIPIREALASGVTKAELVHSAVPLENEEDYPVSDTQLRLTIAYCADGSLDRGKYLRFHLKKQRKIDRLNLLLGELGVTPSWGPAGSNGGKKLHTLPRWLVEDLMRLAPGKVLPRWLLNLSARQRQIAIDELHEWDGSALHYDGKQFASFKQEELDLVQLLLAQHGIFGRIHRDRGLLTYNSSRESNGAATLSSIVQWESTENEAVGCITTEHQNFVVRTHAGRVEVTGNTHRGGTHYEGTIGDGQHVALNVGWLGDIESPAVDYKHRDLARRHWQHGFGWVEQDSTGMSWCNFVPILSGRAVVSGKAYSGRVRAVG